MSTENTEIQENPYQDDLEAFGMGTTVEDIMQEQDRTEQAEQETTDVETGESKTDGKAMSKTVSEETEVSEQPELSAEQIRQIFGEEVSVEQLQQINKVHTNNTEWERKLKQKAQAISFFNKIDPEKEDVVLARLAPFVANKEQIPDTPEDLIADAVEKYKDTLPEYIEHEDEDGYTVKVPKDKFLPHVNKLINAVFKGYLPELGTLRQSYSSSQQQLNDYQAQVVKLQEANGMLILNSFLSQNPHHSPTVNSGESVIDALLRIEQSGDDHPEYNKYLRFKVAGDHVQNSLNKGKPITFDQAWETLYGKSDRETDLSRKAKEDVKRAQQNGSVGETPGKQVPPNPNQEVLDAIPMSHLDKVNEMFK